MNTVSNSNHPTHKKKYTVLLVEDEKLLRELFTQILTEEGIDVISLPDPREQIEVMMRTKDHLDLVISDIVHPYKDGLKSLAEIKQIDGIKHIPWAMCTVLAHEAVITEAIKCGASYFMNKNDYIPDQFVKEVVSILNHDKKNIKSSAHKVLAQLKLKEK